MNSISVVIPVFNAEPNLRELVGQLIPQLEFISKEFEIVLVDDCSRDASWSIITEMQSADLRVRGIRLSRNYGQHNALLCGIRAAKNQVIVTMDDDLQNLVGEIPKLLRALDEGFDVVYGTPEKLQHGLPRLEQPGGGIEISPAGPEDEEELAAMAGSILSHGRFHQDPRLGSEIGNRGVRAGCATVSVVSSKPRTSADWTGQPSLFSL
jgi:glycosyltransferase involved in cell wall biosynthesis